MVVNKGAYYNGPPNYDSKGTSSGNLLAQETIIRWGRRRGETVGEW